MKKDELITVADLELVKNELISKMDEFQQSVNFSKNVKEVMNFKETCEYLGFSKHHLYDLVRERKIPHSKKGKLLFRRDKLLEWVDSGERKMNEKTNSKFSLTKYKGCIK